MIQVFISDDLSSCTRYRALICQCLEVVVLFNHCVTNLSSSHWGIV